MENNVLQQLKENIAKVMIGNERTIELVLTCLVAKGHILLEDVPGTGKTVMAKSLRNPSRQSSAASSSHRTYCRPMLPVSIILMPKAESSSFERPCLLQHSACR